MSDARLARKIKIDETGLTIDGEPIPYLFDQDVTVSNEGGMPTVTIRFFAEHVNLDVAAAARWEEPQRELSPADVRALTVEAATFGARPDAAT